MAIFGDLELEATVQIGDRTRLSALKSFTADEAAISLVEIEPESGSGFIDVTGSNSNDWYLDWRYSGASRVVTCSVRITTDGAPVVHTKDINILTATDDKLFSSDQDLTGLESDILRWVRPGRNTFLDFHRKSQFLIIDFINNDLGARKAEFAKYDKNDVVEIDEVNKWSTYLTLSQIFEDLSNAVDDVFAQKRAYYQGLANSARDRSYIRIDQDNDGIIDVGEIINIKTGDLVRS